jgi:predicted acylesterase/phospholipase RssA
MAWTLRLSAASLICAAVGICAALSVEGCAPITSPKLTVDCSPFEGIYRASQTGPQFTALPSGASSLTTDASLAGLETLAGEGNAVNAPRATENILVLSGGAQWGAYGSGFINGFYGPGSRRSADEPTLGQFTRITGISTGAMMTTYTWAAVLWDRLHPGEAGNPFLENLHKIYTYTDKDLFTAKQPKIGYVLFSNGFDDPAGLLEKKVDDGATDTWPLLKGDDETQVSVGAVNALDGQFRTFDLVKMVKADTANAHACYGASILASSAIPLAFPPRFIDGDPYVDGGVEFLVYLDNIFESLNGKLADSQPHTINIRVIVNGNQSPNDPGHDVQQALACDATVVSRPPNCVAISNSLLGSVSNFGGDPKGLIFRVTQDIILYQIKKDSVYRIYEDWRELLAQHPNVKGTFKVTWIPNDQLADPSQFGVGSGPCQKTSTASFDLGFERCLYDIGRAKGQAAHWEIMKP